MEHLFTFWEYKGAFIMWQSHTSYAKTTQGQDKLTLGEIQDGSKIEDQDGHIIMEDDSHVNCLSFFDNHVLKMKQTFHMGYKEGEKVLHISPTNWEAKKVLVNEYMGSWNEMWRRRNFFILIPTCRFLQQDVFLVYDGNHKLHAWMSYINKVHLDEELW
jgi:hypothetical protein